MKPKIDYTLYLVTDQHFMNVPSIEIAVESAIKGGCTLVQLREKDLGSLAFYEIAQKVKHITVRYNVPLIINDRVDIALAVDADGVHVGQSDLPAGVVRKLIGPDKILGVSASNLPEAIAASDAGADYLGVGAMFATGTKTDAELTAMEELLQIKDTISLPIVVIGGINNKTIPLFCDSGIDGIAVVSAILSQPDITKAAKELKKLFLLGKEPANEF